MSPAHQAAQPAYKVVATAERHLEGFHAVLDGVAREKRYLALVKAPAMRVLRKFVLGNIDKGNPQFVALHGREVVGWCDIVGGSQETRQHSGVLGIGIAPAHRGNGVGRRLLEAAIDAAWNGRFTRIELTVREDNARAIALYEAFGFEREGRARNAFRIEGEYHHLLSMARLKEG